MAVLYCFTTDFSRMSVGLLSRPGAGHGAKLPGPVEFSVLKRLDFYTSG